MINKPTVSDLLKKSENRYELVIATAKRARQISMGRAKLIDTDEENPVTIAANEINEGKVRIVDESELSKNSDQLLREREEEELRMLEKNIIQQVEESKKIEESIKNKHQLKEQINTEEKLDINYENIAKDIELDNDTLLELMNGAGLLDSTEGFQEVDGNEE